MYGFFNTRRLPRVSTLVHYYINIIYKHSKTKALLDFVMYIYSVHPVQKVQKRFETCSLQAQSL